MKNRYSHEKILNKNKDKLLPVIHVDYSVSENGVSLWNMRTKKLDKDELNVLFKIDGQKSIQEYERIGVDCNKIWSLYKRGIILFKKKNMISENKKRKILILSPHLDDVAFSMSGYIAKYNTQYDFYILDFFGEQKYSLYEKFGIGEKQLLYEEKFFWEYMGIKEGKVLTFPDAALRKMYKGKKIIDIDTEISDEEIIESEKKLYSEIKSKIYSTLKQTVFEEIFLPMGIGRHVDHVIVKKAGLEVINQFDVKGTFYIDMPYALLLDKSELVNMKGQAFNVTDEIWIKENALSIYKSQLTNKQKELIVQYGLLSGEYYEWFINI